MYRELNKLQPTQSSSSDVKSNNAPIQPDSVNQEEFCQEGETPNITSRPEPENKLPISSLQSVIDSVPPGAFHCLVRAHSVHPLSSDPSPDLQVRLSDDTAVLDALISGPEASHFHNTLSELRSEGIRPSWLVRSTSPEPYLECTLVSYTSQTQPPRKRIKLVATRFTPTTSLTQPPELH